MVDGRPPVDELGLIDGLVQVIVGQGAEAGEVATAGGCEEGLVFGLELGAVVQVGVVDGGARLHDGASEELVVAAAVCNEVESDRHGTR